MGQRQRKMEWMTTTAVRWQSKILKLFRAQHSKRNSFLVENSSKISKTTTTTNAETNVNALSPGQRCFSSSSFYGQRRCAVVFLLCLLHITSPLSHTAQTHAHQHSHIYVRLTHTHIQTNIYNCQQQPPKC